MGLINKTALVTGANSGIGFHSIAKLYYLLDKMTREFKDQAAGIPKNLLLTGV